MKLVIIGCGKVGSEIAKRLSKKSYTDNLILYDKIAENAKNLADSINDRKVSFTADLNKIQDPDYLIISLSAISPEKRQASFMNRANTSQVRHDELKPNLSAFREILPVLNKFKDKSAIIVVSNPVEQIIGFLHDELKSDKLYGFGLSMDVARYKRKLKKEVICIGEHGNAIPILNLASEKEYEKLHEEIDSEVMNFIRTHGMTYKVTGEEFEKFFDNLVGKKKATVYLARWLDKETLGVKNQVTSLPYIIKNGKIVGLLPIKPSKLELKLFRSQVA